MSLCFFKHDVKDISEFYLDHGGTKSSLFYDGSPKTLLCDMRRASTRELAYFLQMKRV